MNNYFIFIIIILIVGIVAGWKLLKGALKFVSSAIGILLLIIAVIGAMIYVDVQELRSIAEDGEKIIIYEHEGQMTAGIAFTGEEITISESEGLPEGIRILSEEELSILEESYGEEKAFKEAVKDMMNNSEENIIIIVEESVFEEFEEIELGPVMINETIFEEIMTEDDVLETLIETYAEQEAVNSESQNELREVVEEGLDDANIESDQEIKTTIFMLEVSETFNDLEITSLVEEVKEGDIRIAPDFMTITLLKKMPDSWFEKITKKLSNKETEEE